MCALHARRGEQQLDLYQRSPQRLAQAHRIQAETWLHNPYWPMSERQKRHDYDMQQADRIEREAREI